MRNRVLKALRIDHREVLLRRFRRGELFLNSLNSSMDDRGELQIRACRRLSRAELKIELRAWIDIADLGRWTDANPCFAIAKAEIVESRAPAIRR